MLQATLNRTVPDAPGFLTTRGIWITWENQRRTKELANALGLPVDIYISRNRYLVRIVHLSVKTTVTLIKLRPRVLFVQNPSIVLAALACVMQRLLGYVLVVDRHSNFRIEKAPFRSIKEKLFQLLSRYTIRKAHLTILTNEFLKNLVEQWGGRGFVLQDKLPALELADKIELAGKRNIVFICSYSGDEPVTEVIEAARLLDPSILVYITGNYHKLSGKIIVQAPKNVIFTGFVEEKDYQSLLYSCDGVMALTTADHFLLCGAYEAISLGKPLILSNTADLREYFYKGAALTANDRESLAEAIMKVLNEKERLEGEVLELRQELAAAWDKRFSRLLEQIENLSKMCWSEKGVNCSQRNAKS